MSQKGTPVTPDTSTRSDKVQRTRGEHLSRVGGARRYGHSTGSMPDAGCILGCAAKAARS